MRFRAEQFGAARIREILSGMLVVALPPVTQNRIDLGRFVSLDLVGQLGRTRRSSSGLADRWPIQVGRST